VFISGITGTRPQQTTWATTSRQPPTSCSVAPRSSSTNTLAGKRTQFDLPIALVGEPSRRRVWELLADIAYGQTITYGELAAKLADGTTAYEVGQVVGRNPLTVVVPCHRVVGKNGVLTGYAGGLKRKRFLLDLEEPVPAVAGRLF
jgi:methylated-DNA-[protein]-cysteine S-methyltransferase